MPSDNPQKEFIEPLPGVKAFARMPKDDIDPAFLYDINEALLDAEDERRRKRSHANVGYADLKKRPSGP